LRVLNSGDVVGARDLFKSAVAKYAGEGSINEDTANFFYAFTRVAALWFDIQSDGQNDGLNDIGDILDAFGCSQSGRDPSPVDDDVNNMIDTICPDILPSTSPTGQELQTFLYNVVRPELEGAVANLNRVSQSFNINWTEPFDDTAVESDYGDALVLRAMAKASLSAIYIQNAYNLNGDIDVEVNGEAVRTAQDFLADNPSFLSLVSSGTGSLSTAKSYLTGSALDDMDAAIDWMNVTETDPQNDDWINLIDETASDITDAKADIATAKTCIIGPGQCTADNKGTPSTSDDDIINLSPFFAGLNIRPFVPSYAGEDHTGLWPDPTFGGVFIKMDGDNPSVLNDDLDSDGTADGFEEDLYYVYGGNTFPPNFDGDPETQGFTRLGIANAASGISNFSGAYSYYYIRTNRTNSGAGEFGPFDFENRVYIDAFEFLGSGGYCCSASWWSYNLWWWSNMTGAPDSIASRMGDGGYILMQAPVGRTGIRVYGKPTP
ncbi:MAG: hypothetical protein HY753_00405, partial [Nitrospirae bacterium]|nr:hypothetical protein [Nitrospirota bacterium]